MAQEAVNAVVQAFQRGMEQVQARNARQEELKLQQQREKAEEDARNKQQDLAERQFAAAQKSADMQHQLLMAEFEARKAHQEYQDLGTFQQTGITPPGATAQPNPQFNLSTAGPAGIPVPIPTSAATSLTYPGTAPSAMQVSPGPVPTITPIGGTPSRTYNVPSLAESPSVQLAFQQKSEEQRSQYDFLLRNAQVLAREAQENKVVNDAKAHDYAMAVKRLEGENSVNVANVNYDRAIEVARMRENQSLTPSVTLRTGPDGTPDFSMSDPTNYADNFLQRAWDGNMTFEQLKGAVPNPKDREKITTAGANIGGGIQFITDKQLQAFQDLQKVSAILPDLKHLHDLRNDHWLQLAFPTLTSITPGTYNPVADFNSTKERVEGMMPVIIRVLASMNRYNTQEAEKKARALIPSTDIIHSRAGTERQKFDQFVEHELQDDFNIHLGTLPLNQQKNFRNKMGLPDLSSAISAPGATHPQPDNTTAPNAVPKTVPQGKVLVRDKMTGEVGMQSKEVYNRYKNRYELYQVPEQK